MRIFGLVQARMGSTRLPGKAMRPICGEPLVGHIFDRLSCVRGLAGTVLATTADLRNDELAAYAAGRGLAVYREIAEDDIAARLAGAARHVDAESILKINGDCPMVDVALLQQLVATFVQTGDADYVSNKIVWTYPEGLSAEVISSRALEWCDANLHSAQDREFAANWIRDHADRFKVVSVTGTRDLSRYRWVVDTPEDFAFIAQVFERLHRPGRPFGLEEVLALLEEDRALPWLMGQQL